MGVEGGEEGGGAGVCECVCVYVEGNITEQSNHRRSYLRCVCVCVWGGGWITVKAAATHTYTHTRGSAKGIES